MTSSSSASSTPPPQPPPRPSRNEVPVKDRGPRAKAQSSPARDLVLIATFAALTIALGLPGAFPVSASPTPIVIQNLGIVMMGLLLGWRRGGLSALLFVVMGSFLPVLAGGRGGLHIWSTPSAGYLIGYVLAPILMGLVVAAFGSKLRTTGFIVAAAVGILTMLLCGTFISYMGMQGFSIGKAFATGFAPFIIGGVIKAIVAVIVARGVVAAYPKILA